jgi:hypothetical protein
MGRGVPKAIPCPSAPSPPFPRRFQPHLVPNRTVQGFVQFLRHFHHAEVAGVGMVAFLVDIRKGMRALRAVYWLRPPAISMSALVLAITFSSSWALPFCIMMPSLPSRVLIRALSSVLFLVLVAATSMPRS